VKVLCSQEPVYGSRKSSTVQLVNAYCFFSRAVVLTTGVSTRHTGRVREGHPRPQRLLCQAKMCLFHRRFKLMEHPRSTPDMYVNPSYSSLCRNKGWFPTGASIPPLQGWLGCQTCSTNPDECGRLYRGRGAGFSGWSCTPCQAFSSLPAPGGPGEVRAGIYCRRRIKASSSLLVHPSPLPGLGVIAQPGPS
jgi:hypothetical protein